MPLATVVAVGVVLFTVPISSGDDRIGATIQLTDVSPPPDREVEATVTLDPPDAAEDARWLNVTSWQGQDEPSIVQKLDEQAPGVYRTTEPVPVDGTWKSILRLHRDDEVLGLPIFLPEDSAIPAPETPAPPAFTRQFQLDKKNLQREQKEGVSAVLTTLSYVAVLLITISLLAAIFWGLRRIRLTLGSDEGPPAATGTPLTPRRAPSAPRPAT